jgi:hypothetical protein
VVATARRSMMEYERCNTKKVRIIYFGQHVMKFGESARVITLPSVEVFNEFSFRFSIDNGRPLDHRRNTYGELVLFRAVMRCENGFSSQSTTNTATRRSV